MPRRHGGGGRGGGQGLAALRNQILQLFDQGSGGTGRGGRGGGSTGGGGGAGNGPRGERGRQGGAGPTREPREGDWTCHACRFSPNFAHRTSCFRCGAGRARRPDERPAAPHPQGGRGPVGAGGSRPLLSSFAAKSAAAAAAGTQPSYRVPGASLAAKATVDASAQLRPWGSSSYHHVTDRAEPPPAVRGKGDDGRRHHLRADCGAAPGGKGRWADEEVPCDRLRDCADSDYADEDLAMDDNEDEGGGDQEEWEDEPTPEDLRQRWLRECRAVKALAAQDKHSSSAALAAAREARDLAEQEWRRSRKPVPLSIRMGFAQKKLDKAEAALTRARLQLDEFDEETDRRRDELCKRIQEADARYRGRVAQMDDLHAEAAGLANDAAAGGAADRSNQEGAVCDMVAMELQAIAETLDEGDDARGRINLLLSRVATATAAARPQAEQFDIGCDDEAAATDDADATWCEESGGRWTRVARKGKSRGKGDSGQPAAPQRGAGAGIGPPTRAGTGATAADTPAAANLDTASDGKGTHRAAPAAPTPAAAASGAPSAAPSAATRGTRRRGGAMEDDTTRSKSHRGEDEQELQSVEVAGDDHRRALKLMEEQAIAAAAAIECQAVFGDERSRQIAGQLYEHKVGLLNNRAAELGIPATSGGRKLIALSRGAIRVDSEGAGTRGRSRK